MTDMSKRIFSKEQVDELLQNNHVVACSQKSVTFHESFKVLAVTQYQQEGLSAMQIFKRAGFNVDAIGRDTPKEALRRWIKVFNNQGAGGLKEKRGDNGNKRRPVAKNFTDQEKIKELEMKVAYLKAENSFLVRLRARRKG